MKWKTIKRQCGDSHSNLLGFAIVKYVEYNIYAGLDDEQEITGVVDIRRLLAGKQERSVFLAEETDRMDFTV